MKTKNVVVCLGDSTTGGSGHSVSQFPRRLMLAANLGPNWHGVNWGVGGATTSAMATTWTNSIRNKYANAAKRWLVVMGGVNDLAGAADNAAACDTAASTAFTNLTTNLIAQAVADANWTGIVFCTPTPAVTYTGWSVNRQNGYRDTASTSLYNRIIAYAATGVQICDVYALLQDAVTVGQISYLGGGGKPDYATNQLGTRDFLHQNDAAHAAIATAIAALIPH